MSILQKLTETVDKITPLTNANELIEGLKRAFRSRLGETFVKANFDSEPGTGMVFLKYAKCNYNEATNSKLEESPINFIVAIEGFNDDGSICEECGGFVVETVKYVDADKKTNKVKRRKFTDINLVKEYLVKYMERYEEHLKEDGVGTSSGAMGSAGSGDDLTIGGGAPDNSAGDIAVFKKRLGDCDKRYEDCEEKK